MSSSGRPGATRLDDGVVLGTGPGTDAGASIPLADFTRSPVRRSRPLLVRTRVKRASPLGGDRPVRRPRSRLLSERSLSIGSSPDRRPQGSVPAAPGRGGGRVNLEEPQAPAPRAASAWEPLRQPLFRILWAAALASSLGSWIEGVTVTWRMAALTGSPLLVSLVQTAGSVAVVLLAIPAGAISDLWGRRSVLLFTQAWAALTMVLFVLAAVSGRLGPVVILSLTFSLGLATTLGWPAWQMTLPEVALPTQMPAAVALNSAQWNVAQVLGPVVTGIVLAAAGAPCALALSALGFAGFLGAAVLWRPATVPARANLRQVHLAGRMAIRYARRSPELRAVLLRTVLFVLPGSAMLALLPLVARQHLGEGVSGYGLLLSLLGAGALVGVVLLPRLAALGPRTLLSAGMCLLAATLVVAGVTRTPWVVWLDLVAAGVSWLVVPTTLVVVVQRVTPVRLRSRGLGVYLVTYQAALALGSAASGGLAGRLGLAATFLLAAGALAAAGCAAAGFPMPDGNPAA